MDQRVVALAIFVALTTGTFGYAFADSKCGFSGTYERFALVPTSVTVDGEAQPLDAYRDKAIRIQGLYSNSVSNAVGISIAQTDEAPPSTEAFFTEVGQ